MARLGVPSPHTLKDATARKSQQTIEAKKRGCLIFEIGEQHFPNQLFKTYPSQKEINISDFKSGFGGFSEIVIDILLSK